MEKRYRQATLLYPGRITPRQLQWLQSKGWAITRWDVVEGTEPVRVSTITGFIADPRFDAWRKTVDSLPC